MSALLGDWVDVAPWRSRRLLLIDHSGTDLRQATGLVDKRRMLDEATGPILAIWPGEWSTTARIVTDEDRVAVREALR